MLAALGACAGVLVGLGPPAGALVSAGVFSSGVIASTPVSAVPPARAEILVDVDTGKMLYGYHEHVPLPPASLSKLLTAMIAADWLKSNAVVPVSARAAGVSPDKVGMKRGQRWPLSITLHALLISSANDAAYALAERVSGSLPRFAALMAEAASQIGMSDHPVLRDPAGLDGTEGLGGGNRISAWDIAVAARDLMANPRLAAIVGLVRFRFTGPDRIVYDLLSHNAAFLQSYPGAIGVKTGFTDPAGVCIAAEAVRGGRHMLAVVLNGVSPDQTAEMLLDRGFATPVKDEPATDPKLPAVREPGPPRPPPPHPEQVARASAGDPANAVPAFVRGRSGSGDGPTGLGYWALAGVAVLATAVGLLARSLRRRRRSGRGAHARR